MKSARTGLRAAIAALLLSGVLLQAGCLAVAAGAAGAGTVAYLRGALVVSLENEYNETVRAANAAIEQLEFAKVSESKDALSAILIARTAEDTRVEIKINRVADRVSKVEIRVGLFGDEAISVAVLDRMKASL